MDLVLTTDDVRDVVLEAAKDEALSLIASENEGALVSLSPEQVRWIEERFGAAFDHWLSTHDVETTTKERARTLRAAAAGLREGTWPADLKDGVLAAAQQLDSRADSSV